jgi:hypothetical protein
MSAIGPKLVTLFGGETVFLPMGARAQQSAKLVIGFLHSASPGQYVGHLAAFRKGLSEVWGRRGETM